MAVPRHRWEQAAGRTQGSEWLAEDAASPALEGSAGGAGRPARPTPDRLFLSGHSVRPPGGKAEPGLAGPRVWVGQAWASGSGLGVPGLSQQYPDWQLEQQTCLFP